MVKIDNTVPFTTMQCEKLTSRKSSIGYSSCNSGRGRLAALKKAGISFLMIIPSIVVRPYQNIQLYNKNAGPWLLKKRTPGKLLLDSTVSAVISPFLMTAKTFKHLGGAAITPSICYKEMIRL